MAEEDVFHARISATDDASKTIAEIRARMVGLVHATDQLGHAQQHVHNEGVWQKLRESVGEAKSQFGELGEHIGGIGEKVAELLPALGALGAAGGLVALFETAEKTAEAYGELAHTAQSLGIAAQQLHVWNTVAKLTDTNAESMGKSMARLNRTLGEVSSGKNKDAAALFRDLHLNPKNFHDSADALPALANAFAHTADATMRARMAQVLFGRAGVEMIPLLMRGSAAIREMQAEAGTLAFNFTGYGEGLEHYNESMKKLGIVTQGFTDEVGAKLAPVLQPVVDEVTNWVLANRDWISTGIVGEVGQLAHWLERVPWQYVGDELHEWAGNAESFVEKIGGGQRVLEVLAGLLALKGVAFLAKETIAIGTFGVQLASLIIKLGTELVGAWFGVGAAAEAAGVKEAAALAVGEGATPAAGANLVRNGLIRAGLIGTGLGVAGYTAETLTRASTLAAGKSRGESDDQSAADYIAGESGVALPDKPDTGPRGATWTDGLSRWLTGNTPSQPTTPGGEVWNIGARELVRQGDPHPYWHSAQQDAPSLLHTPDPLSISYSGNRSRQGDPHPHWHSAQQDAPSLLHTPDPLSISYSGNRSRHAGAPVPAPQGSSRVEISGQASVTVLLPNAPPGTTATASGGGMLAKPSIQVGQAFGDHYPGH